MRNCSQKVSIALTVLAGASMAQAGTGGHQNKRIETRVEKSSVAAPVRYETSRNVGRGRLIKASQGKEGSIKKTFRLIYSNGKLQAKELIKEERIDPQPTVFLMGKQGYVASRGAFVRHKVIDMEATAYDPSPSSNGGTGRTCTGRRAAYGIVAVDPRVIKLGTIVYVEGYGLAIASDIGGAIKGKRIDVCLDSRAACNQFGRRHVKVHILQ